MVGGGLLLKILPYPFRPFHLHVSWTLLPTAVTKPSTFVKHKKIAEIYRNSASVFPRLFLPRFNGEKKGRWARQNGRIVLGVRLRNLSKDLNTTGALGMMGHATIVASYTPGIQNSLLSRVERVSRSCLFYIIQHRYIGLSLSNYLRSTQILK